MNFNQLQIFEYSLYCFHEAVDNSKYKFKKITPIYKSGDKLFTAESIAFDTYSLKIPYDEGIDTNSLKYHTIDSSEGSTEPFFQVRKFIHSELKGGNFFAWEKYLTNPEFLLLALTEYAENADTTDLEKLPHIFREYKELNSNDSLSFYVSESENFTVVSLTDNPEWLY